MKTSTREPWRKRMWRRKWRVVGSIALVLVVAYSGVHAAVSLSSSDTDQFVALPDGSHLAYRIVNPNFTSDHSRQRIIFVHGAPADATSWHRLLESHGHELREFEILVVDRLGYGNSSSATVADLEAQSESLAPLITPGAVLVGHSYGGPVVLHAAAKYSEQLAGIVIAAGACDPYMNDSQWLRRVIDAASPVIPHSWTAANLELLALTDDNQSMIGSLNDVRCRVAVLHGTRDPVCPHDGATNFLQESLSEAAAIRVDSLPRSGHNVHLSHPEKIVELISWIADDR